MPNPQHTSKQQSQAWDRLHRAQAAFERGDYSYVRQMGRDLAHVEDPQLQHQLAQLLAQLKPSRLSYYLYALTLFILTMVTLFAYTR